MRTLPKNWLGKLRKLGCSDEDIRRAQSLVRIAQDEDKDMTPRRELLDMYAFEIFDIAQRLKKYREKDAADPELHTRSRQPKPKRGPWEVSLLFVVGGVWGREVYTVEARDRDEALSAAWNRLQWEALDLKLVGIRDNGIARHATVQKLEAA